MTALARAAAGPSDVIRIARDAFLLSVSSIVASILSFLVWVYIARVLSPDLYGALGAAFAFVALFQMFGDFGINYYAVREGAKAPERAADVFRSLFGVKLAMLAGAVALVAVAAFALPFRATERALILTYLASQPVAGIGAYLGSLLTTHRKMARLASVQLAERGVYAVLMPIFIFAGFGAFGVVLSALLSAGLYAILVRLAVARLLTRPLWPPGHLKSARPHLAAAYQFGLAALMIAIMQRADIVLLAVLSDSMNLAWYIAAAQVFFLLLLVATGLATAAFPWIVQRLNREEMQSRELWQWTAILGVVSVGIALGVLVSAPALFAFLFGEGLAEGAASLRILAWAFVPTLTTIPFSLALDALNLQKVHVVNASVMLGINVALNLSWIPSMGANGAALAAVASWGYGLVAGVPIAYFAIRHRQRSQARSTLSETIAP